MKRLLIYLIPFLMLSQLSLGAVIFQNNNKYGLKDEQNNVLLESEYQKIEQLKYIPPKTILIPMQATKENEEVLSDLYKIKSNNLFGICDKNGKIIHKILYENISINEYGQIVLTKDGVEKVAHPIKNTIEATKNTLGAIIGLPVTIVAGVMMPIEIISKLGQAK